MITGSHGLCARRACRGFGDSTHRTPSFLASPVRGWYGADGPMADRGTRRGRCRSRGAALSFRWEVYGEQSRVCCLRIMCRWAQRRLGIIHPFQKVGASSRNSETVEVSFLAFVRMWHAIFSLFEATNPPVLYCGFVNMRIVHYVRLF